MDINVSNYKCGEIYVTNSGTYSYLCVICNEYFYHSKLYEQHNSDEHFEFEIKEENSSSASHNDENIEENKIDIQSDIKILDTDTNSNGSYILEPDNTTFNQKLNYDELSENEIIQNNYGSSNFMSNENVQHHENNHSICTEFFKCKFCNKMFGNEKELYNHSKTHKDITKISLKKKGTVQHSLELIEKSIQKNMNINNLKNKSKTLYHNDGESLIEKCASCNKLHSNYNEEKCIEIQKKIVEHDNNINELEAEGIFYCQYCLKYFIGKDDLMSHVKKHRDPAMCYICDKPTVDLRRHIKTKHPDNYKEHIQNKFTGECKYCHKVFKKKSALPKHELRHETDDFSCKICGKSFQQIRLLNVHLKIHSNERPHKCEYCPAAFVILKNLTTHRITRHTNDFNFPCTYDGCEQLFKTKELRRRHFRNIHLKEKNHQCEDCGLNFSTTGHLNLHKKKVHMNYEDRQFFCTHCDKKFVQLGDLRRHLVTHTSEKPYICNYKECNKSFGNSKSLTRHKNLHSGYKKDNIRRMHLQKAHVTHDQLYKI